MKKKDRRKDEELLKAQEKQIKEAEELMKNFNINESKEIGKDLENFIEGCEEVCRSQNKEKIIDLATKIEKYLEEDNSLKKNKLFSPSYLIHPAIPAELYLCFGSLHLELSKMKSENFSGWRDSNNLPPENMIKAINYLLYAEFFVSKILFKITEIIDGVECYTNILPGGYRLNELIQIKLSKAREYQGRVIESLNKYNHNFDYASARIRNKGGEKNYRDWCLKECLFINHRNDITTKWIADGDILNFPDYNNPENKGPSLADAFSDLKKEYCFARYLAYEGVDQMQRTYEGNKDDGYIEKMKTALRVSFSTLDSIASIMNNYFKCNSKHISFTPKWIKCKLSQTEKNPFIDALFWLSRDLCKDSKDSEEEKKLQPNEREALSPEFSDIRKIRNAMEHNWLRVAEHKNTDIWNKNSDFAEVITPQELKDHTLSTLKLVRAAMLYLTMAVTCNEKNEEEKRNKKSKAQPNDITSTSVPYISNT